MRAALVALSLLPALAIADISINGPSASAYWVQNTSNTISWTFAAGDPNPVSIIVTNAQNTTLNGAFSIAEFVNVSQETFTVTNVTLRPGSDYQVVFVNSTNATQVYANSTNFEVKPAGTASAPPSNSSSSGSSGSGSPSGTSTSSSSASPSPGSNAPSGASRMALGDVHSLVYAVGACGLVSLTSLFL